MHQNSLKAFTEEVQNLSQRQQDILKFFQSDSSTEYTDREVQTSMGFYERNQVQPRITELIKLGKLREVGKRRCQLTGKSVRLVRYAQ